LLSATVAVQRETRAILIVFASGIQPVTSGFVATLNQPGGNITGFALFEASLGGKWFELLLEIAPGVRRAAIMFNPDARPASVYMPSLQAAARSLKVVPTIAPIHNDLEIETTIMALGREPGGGLVVIPDVFTTVHRAPIILAAARNNVPAVYGQSFLVRDGGLVSYGVDQVDSIRRAATYMSIAFCAARSREISRCSFRQNSSSSSTSRPPRPSASPTIPETLLATADEVIQ
jgi:putative ABC transport system substrate-binding protein